MTAKWMHIHVYIYMHVSIFLGLRATITLNNSNFSEILQVQAAQKQWIATGRKWVRNSDTEAGAQPAFPPGQPEPPSCGHSLLTSWAFLPTSPALLLLGQDGGTVYRCLPAGADKSMLWWASLLHLSSTSCILHFILLICRGDEWFLTFYPRLFSSPN